MIDIHSHVLWGMDDGAPTQDVSLEMLRIAAEAGTTDIVATPHSNSKYEYVPEVIDERIRILNEELGGKPRVYRGCDLHLSYDNVAEALENPSKFAINGRRYVLVEFSDFNISGSMSRVFDQLLDASLVPIITHPERNPILQKELTKLDAWVDKGCLVQVTALSVLGGFGKSAEKAAHQLLAKGIVHIIASDAHDPEHRHPRLDGAYAAIGKQYGEETAEMLLDVNPGHVIRGEGVDDGRIVMAPRRKWWPFG